MWICTKCYHKNNNSNSKCHGPNCNAPKPEQIKQQQEKQIEKTQKRDYCPVCHTHRDFHKIIGEKNKWVCEGCKKKFRSKGKPVPEPKNDTNVTLLQAEK